MKEKKTSMPLIGIMVFSLVGMFIIEYYIIPGYIIKSLSKIVLFFILPLIYIDLGQGLLLSDFFKLSSKRQFFTLILFGVSTFVLITGGYFILNKYLDLSQIRQLLYESRDVNKTNILYISIYISFFNSLLEEFFFRGFIFLSLNKITTKPVAYVVSALAFAAYHIGIMADWNAFLFVLVLIALFLVGLLFNYLNEKNKNIYTSWFVHMFANFALNTIGLLIFGVF